MRRRRTDTIERILFTLLLSISLLAPLSHSLSYSCSHFLTLCDIQEITNATFSIGTVVLSVRSPDMQQELPHQQETVEKFQINLMGNFSYGFALSKGFHLILCRRTIIIIFLNSYIYLHLSVSSFP